MEFNNNSENYDNEQVFDDFYSFSFQDSNLVIDENNTNNSINEDKDEIINDDKKRKNKELKYTNTSASINLNLTPSGNSTKK